MREAFGLKIRVLDQFHPRQKIKPLGCVRYPLVSVTVISEVDVSEGANSQAAPIHKFSDGVVVP